MATVNVIMSMKFNYCVLLNFLTLYLAIFHFLCSDLPLNCSKTASNLRAFKAVYTFQLSINSVAKNRKIPLKLTKRACDWDSAQGPAGGAKGAPSDPQNRMVASMFQAPPIKKSGIRPLLCAKYVFD
jgi:hypothetical protein